jgi:hypothetical protein
MKTLAPTLLVVACACVLAGITAGGTARSASASSRVALRVDLRDEIGDARSEARRWRRVMGLRPLRARPVRMTTGAHYQRWLLRLWRKRAQAFRVRAQNPPHRSAFLCIHRFEGPWTAATGNGYFGGLQMDIAFQRLYGRHLLRRKGTANHWTPLEQIWVAERAHRSGRGFSPWPRTARTCGLF